MTTWKIVDHRGADVFGADVVARDPRINVMPAAKVARLIAVENSDDMQPPLRAVRS
tara:strand:+ start:285 stop:452 length:168 start_codon:yes stop_codon:yes gene_type:complete